MVLGLRQKLGISVFIMTAPAAKVLSWQQHQGWHFVSFVIHICGARFQEHCSNTSRDIVYSVFSTF